MKEEKRTFHKQRKWICPHCGKVSFQGQRKFKDGKQRGG